MTNFSVLLFAHSEDFNDCLKHKFVENVNDMKEIGLTKIKNFIFITFFF